MEQTSGFEEVPGAPSRARTSEAALLQLTKPQAFAAATIHLLFNLFFTLLCNPKDLVGSDYCPWATAKETSLKAVRSHREPGTRTWPRVTGSSTLSLKVNCMYKALAELGSSSQGIGKAKMSRGQKTPLGRENRSSSKSVTGQKWREGQVADPSSGPIPVGGTTGARCHAQLIFCILVETGSHRVVQAGLELLSLGDPPALASQGVGITGMSHRTRP
ncbi:hypothetical protein AAY473_006508 [Plecturocebus cupreus]